MNDLVITSLNVGRPLTVSEVKGNIDVIKSVMKEVMQEGVHYGTIPGCGDKNALLQPGAHKLGLLFNLGPSFAVDERQLPGDHREYQVVCTLVQRETGREIAQGIGVCSTMESKYRFRWDNTNQPVPQSYWESRNLDDIGGPSFAARKAWVEEDGRRKQRWFIFQRIEHDNPADYYNTVAKIGKKRAYNDAILTATAASDIFAPDDDTDPEFMHGKDKEPGSAKPTPPSQGRSEPRARTSSQESAAHDAPRGDASPAADKPISEGAWRILRAKLAQAGLNDKDLRAKWGDPDALVLSQFNAIQDWIAQRAAA